MSELRRPFPKEFLDRYSQFIPDFDDFLSAMRTPLHRTFRINTLKTSRERALELLADLKPQPIPWTDIGFSVEDGERLGMRIEHFIGLIYVQEAASMVPPLLLSPLPRERVLDLAAAPGSKTTQMSAMMQNSGLVIANDQSPGRVRALISNVDRAGCLNVVVCRRDGGILGQALKGSCDRVLVDAPCSSEGTMRKSDEAIDRWSVAALRRFSGLQRRLALAGYDALKPGGTMVYSTCTVAPEEDEGVVAELLKARPEAELLSAALPGLVTRPGLRGFEAQEYPAVMERALRILPQDNDTEAFFAAVVRRPER
jgi:NOL1/NOP2/sun family putative RNA methylase